MCPTLQDLTLKLEGGQYNVEGDQAAWEAAVRTLPATLRALQISTDYSSSSQAWRSLVQSLAATTQLTQLQELRITWAAGQSNDNNDLAPLAAIASKLTLLSLEDTEPSDGRNSPSHYHAAIVGVQQLLTACSSTLTSLKLPRKSLQRPSLALLPRLAPHLRSLDMSQLDPSKVKRAEVLHVLKQLTSLTHLAPPSLTYLVQLSKVPGAKGALAHVRELEFREDEDEEETYVHQWLHVIDSRLLDSSVERQQVISLTQVVP